VPVAVNVKPAVPDATEAGEIEASVGVTTPWKPPHAEINAQRTSKNDRARSRRRLMLGIAFPED
jgi:hypothetical protein